MSYNYLPLDRKPLLFDQVKNLLDFEQLVSITFDAHEQILKCSDYLDKKIFTNEQLAQLQYDLPSPVATFNGNEVPTPVVKLLVMLKIKSLSYGHSAVEIETVKRLMEAYNNDIFPVIYIDELLNNTTVLQQLCLTLNGLGDVYFKGEKMAISQVLEMIGWQPLQLKNEEALTIVNGTQFTTSYGLFCLKKIEQLLVIADLVAALSFTILGYNLSEFDTAIHTIHAQKGQVNTAEILRGYLSNNTKIVTQNEASVISQVHGAAKDIFDFVLQLFMAEVNSVTDGLLIFPDKEAIVFSKNYSDAPLIMGLEFLKASVKNVNVISTDRINKMFMEPSLKPQNEDLVSTFQTVENDKDLLKVIEDLENILAIELQLGAAFIGSDATSNLSMPIKKFLRELEQFNNYVYENEIAKTVAFITTYTI